MIPIELQAGLKSRMQEVFTGPLFNSPSGERVPLTVYEQNLPQKSKDDISYYPFVIVKLLEGEKKTEQGEHLTQVGFIIGTFDEDNENQGYRDVTMIINKIMGDLSENPLINGEFELQFPLKWHIHDEETDPYYFGAVETTWSVPTYSRKDVEALT
jgi:hypothetical protein